LASAPRLLERTIVARRKLVGAEVRAILRFSDQPDLEARLDDVMERLEAKAASPAIGVNLKTGEVEISVYVHVEGDADIRDLFQQGFDAIAQALDHAGIPLDEIDDEEFSARPSRELIGV
jgi:hypothetical protein